MSGNLQADRFGALKAAARLDLGLLCCHLECDACVKTGELQVVLRGYQVFPKPGDESRGCIYEVYPYSKHTPPKGRVYLYFAVDYIGNPPFREHHEAACGK